MVRCAWNHHVLSELRIEPAIVIGEIRDIHRRCRHENIKIVASHVLFGSRHVEKHCVEFRPSQSATFTPQSRRKTRGRSMTGQTVTSIGLVPLRRSSLPQIPHAPTRTSTS